LRSAAAPFAPIGSVAPGPPGRPVVAAAGSTAPCAFAPAVHPCTCRGSAVFRSPAARPIHGAPPIRVASFTTGTSAARAVAVGTSPAVAIATSVVVATSVVPTPVAGAAAGLRAITTPAARSALATATALPIPRTVAAVGRTLTSGTGAGSITIAVAA
jgi:hypothetical protein